MLDSELVHLRGGLVAPAAALRLLLDLEARGFKVWADDGDIVINPASRLTPEDARLIRGWKADLLALVVYTAPEVIQ